MNRRSFLATAGAYAALAATGIPAKEENATPPMKVLLWCWDARMTWDDEPDRIQTVMAASEKRFPYPKRPEAFRTGFRRLVDYCAANGIWGIVVWGFLREAHGGVAEARDLCLYAQDRNVTIIPGVGLCAYGGFFFEGDHPFNLNTYLHQHPERASAAREEGGGREVAGVLDPSLPENQQWWRDGLEWMLETFPVSGVNFEMGDFMVNPAPEAAAARAALGFEADENILDMVVATQSLLEFALHAQPDGVFINALYRGYQQIKQFPATPYVDALPPETVWQYTLTRMARDKRFPDEFSGMARHRQYGYLHWFNASTNTQGKDYTRDIARVFSGAHHLGFEFIGTYGELRADKPVADCNYRAQVAWARDPTLDYDNFS